MDAKLHAEEVSVATPHPSGANKVVIPTGFEPVTADQRRRAYGSVHFGDEAVGFLASSSLVRPDFAAAVRPKLVVEQSCSKPQNLPVRLAYVMIV